MKQYKVLLFGLGSIGRRHIKVLKEIIGCNIFVFRQKNKTKEDIPEVEEYIFNWDYLQNKNIDFAIICNPPVFHIDTAIILAKKNIPSIIEKPVCVSMNNVPQLIRLVNDKNLPVLVGFNLRHPQFLREKKVDEDNMKQEESSILLGIFTCLTIPHREHMIRGIFPTR